MMNYGMQSDKFKELYWKTCKAYMPTDFEKLMSDIHAVRPDAHQKLVDAGIEKWSRAKCPANRYNYMTSNNVESINALTKEVRKIPITSLMDWFKDLLQKWYYERRQKYKDAPDDELTPWAITKIKYRCLKSSNWSVKGFFSTKSMRTETTIEYIRFIWIKLNVRVADGSYRDYHVDVIENGNSFKLASQTTTNADGSSTTLIPGLVTADEKTQKKNDVKARSMLLMVLPNEYLLTFNQYKDAKTLFAAIQIRFDGFRIFFDDLYNNFKIVEQEVKGTANSSSSSSSQNMAFVSTPNSTNEVNTAYGVRAANTQDLEQIYEDDIEEMDLKWQLVLLSMRTRSWDTLQESVEDLGTKTAGTGIKTVLKGL
ncbi:hypothetical protein Tco_0619540 [Tanacetum coccineum]